MRTVSTRSGFQLVSAKACDTTRVPGLSASMNLGGSLRMSAGSRYTVTTLAREMSETRTSPSTNDTRSATPALRALARDLSTRARAGSMPRARARARLLHRGGGELDARAARAELARRLDHDAAVARAQIDHEIPGPGAGELQHALHALCGRGDEGRLLHFLRANRERRRDQHHPEARPPQSSDDHQGSG